MIASFIFKDFFIISSSSLLPKSHLSHFLHPGGEPSSGSGHQNQDHVFEWEMGQSPGPGVLAPGTWLGHRSGIGGTRGIISGCCSPGFSTLQTQPDLRFQFTAGWLNPSQVSYETGLTPELFGFRSVALPKQGILPQPG